MTTQAAATAATPTVEREVLECVVCEYSTDRHGAMDELEKGVPLCPFCAVYFKSDMPLAGEVPECTTTELMGAWSDFAEQLVQYAHNMRRYYNRAKRQQEALLLSVLKPWAKGEPIEGNERQKAIDRVLWVTAYGRILALVEAAESAADDLQYQWNPDAVRETISDPAIKPVWDRWMVANADKGMAVADGADKTEWQRGGLHHFTECGKFLE